MSPSPGVVMLSNFRDGEFVEQPYKLFSSRLPEFLKRYPPEKGWRVVRTVQAACELSPNLARLHEAAISAGKSPESIGLPPIPSGFVMTARLLDPQGNEIASGSAFSMGLDLQYAVQSVRSGSGDVLRKDFEAGETAAFQRLLAAVGIGGDVFDVDEATTIRDMGRTPPASITPAATTATRSSKGSKSQPRAGGTESSLLDQVNAVPCPSKPGCNTVMDSPAESRAAIPAVEAVSGDQARLRSMQQQIARIAKQLHAETQPVETLEAAAAELSRLGSLVQQRATAKS